MASVSDIDTKKSVGKFLQRQLLTPRSDESSNTADEVGALLETIAVSFLLYPQAVLPIVLRAKNTLIQIIRADIDVVDFIVKAIGDIRNPDLPVSDTSDLVEAQTALVELDRLGRVSSDLAAFDRYRAAIDRFLDSQLGPTLKRNRRREFERTGEEARQDIFSILPQFGATHRVMADGLADLEASVSDFRSVDLRRIVSVTTISRVRSSLRRVKSRIESGSVSKTVAALELLSGSSSLEAISADRDLFDPTVRTGEFPRRRTIYASSPAAQASAESSSGPWDLEGSGWTFEGSVDHLGTEKAFSFEIPGPGASGRAYVSSEFEAPVDVPVGGTLYIHLEGASSPNKEISITSGDAVSLETIISDIDLGLGADGTCIQNPGTDGLLIFGAVGVTSITVRPDSAAPSGTYNEDPSVHELLGFPGFHTSEEIGHFTSDTLALALRNQISGASVEVVDDKVLITSNTTDARKSSLEFGGSGVQLDFGFSGTYEALPEYLELVEDGSPLDMDDLGVFLGSTFTVAEGAIVGSSIRTLNNQAVSDIEGTKIFFDQQSLPRGEDMSVTVVAPVVLAVQEMTQLLGNHVGEFDEDFSALQRVLSPLLSNPTSAQINDAKGVLSDIQERLESLLNDLEGIEVRADRSEFAEIAQKILKSLEERGLDRATDLISTGRFSAFFSLEQNSASKSSRFMKSMEDLVTNDIPVSTIEQDIDDGQRPRGDNPREDILPDVELEDEGELISGD